MMRTDSTVTAVPVARFRLAFGVTATVGGQGAPDIVRFAELSAVVPADETFVISGVD